MEFASTGNRLLAAVSRVVVDLLQNESYNEIYGMYIFLVKF